LFTLLSELQLSDINLPIFTNDLFFLSKAVKSPPAL